MKNRYMLTQTSYSGDEEIHIVNVSWAMADALCKLLVMQGAHEAELSIDEMVEKVKAYDGNP